jgi:hypothetical protein
MVVPFLRGHALPDAGVLTQGRSRGPVLDMQTGLFLSHDMADVSGLKSADHVFHPFFHSIYQSIEIDGVIDSLP